MVQPIEQLVVLLVGDVSGCAGGAPLAKERAPRLGRDRTGAEEGNRSGRRLTANPPVRKQEFHHDDDGEDGDDQDDAIDDDVDAGYQAR